MSCACSSRCAYNCCICVVEPGQLFVDPLQFGLDLADVAAGGGDGLIRGAQILLQITLPPRRVRKPDVEIVQPFGDAIDVAPRFRDVFCGARERRRERDPCQTQTSKPRAPPHSTSTIKLLC